VLKKCQAAILLIVFFFGQPRRMLGLFDSGPHRLSVLAFLIFSRGRFSSVQHFMAERSFHHDRFILSGLIIEAAFSHPHVLG